MYENKLFFLAIAHFIYFKRQKEQEEKREFLAQQVLHRGIREDWDLRISQIVHKLHIGVKFHYIILF
jgi:hypothetical protein